MTELQRRRLKNRWSSAVLGILILVGWSGYVGWAIATEPPTKLWQWAIFIFASVMMLFIFGTGTFANAWALGVCQAIWNPDSESVRYELKRTNDDLAKQRAKLEAKLR